MEQIGFFPHEKASIHACKSTSKWLKSYMVSVLNWPTLSPNFHPIENAWVILTSSVYQNSKLYSSVEELKWAIEDARLKVKPEHMCYLRKTMYFNQFNLKKQ
ncbi:hypothetical protein AVEN_269596-1 [Araneus ventricosus]|uniref:Tc1-like transposase DDE domain-containing protein n=1 Tax=Araneus ventricosus TaxID=182803 RepID=A0A4Y2CCC4_ARAVE|nr:hypothetical protein AVEN_269596-1 [Araneus ventricosus]